MSWPWFSTLFLAGAAGLCRKAMHWFPMAGLEHPAELVFTWVPPVSLVDKTAAMYQCIPCRPERLL